ncbi:hypothetical protein SK128_022297 [Halocaridina rubra]|uniref:Uncharacterized protein n=1 Tax=Halocaridina rubra TaxID=373956 RepID=A0AAN8XGT3_HALRR
MEAHTLNMNIANEFPDAKDEPEEEGTALQVTGAGLINNGGNGSVGEGGRGGGGGSSCTTRNNDGKEIDHQHQTGGVTPATSSISSASFRKRSKVNTTTPSSRTSRRSSAVSSHSNASSVISTERALKEVSHLPADTVEDALLPRKPEEELTELTGSRALAIRLVDHPAPTNCTKYVVLRPNTAPSPAPVTKAPLLPKRPKTAKIIRKVPEIEFALKWDLKESDIMEENEEDEDAIEVVTLKKSGKQHEPPTPRSVSSVDSGIHAPKAAWNDGPDTRELTTKLENLKLNHGIKSQASTPEPESGYGTPKSLGSGESLPSVASRVSSRVGSVKGSPKTNGRSPGSASSTKTACQKISMDSERLTQESPKSSIRSRVTSPGVSKHTEKSSSSASKQSHSSVKDSKLVTPHVQEQKPPAPKQRDPLEIMETMDSVFHTVPLRDTGRSVTYRSQLAEKHHIAAGTQTDEQLEDAILKREADANEYHATDTKIRHNHPKHIRSRNCLACEVRALKEPPKKFLGPSDYKPAFKAGKPHQQSNITKPRYIRQSERYNARIRARHEPLRIWKINTLSSPFCNRPGYGQDQYPDHMRLRSTYGMANATTTATKPSRGGPLIKKLYL